MKQHCDYKICLAVLSVLFCLLVEWKVYSASIFLDLYGKEFAPYPTKLSNISKIIFSFPLSVDIGGTIEICQSCQMNKKKLVELNTCQSE